MFSSSRCIAAITFRMSFIENLWNVFWQSWSSLLSIMLIGMCIWSLEITFIVKAFFCWFPVIKYFYKIQLLSLQIASLSNYNFNMRYSIFIFPHINPCIVNCNTCLNNFTVSVMIDFILTRLICTSVYCVSSQHPYFWIKISPHRR